MERDAMEAWLLQFVRGGGMWEVEYDELPPARKIFRSVWELEVEVNNGGFEQYFANFSGELVAHADPALEALGAPQMAAIVSRAIEVIGSDTDWEDIDARHARLEALSDEALDRLDELAEEFVSYPEDLVMLLHAHVLAHKAEFGVSVQ